MNCCRSAWSRSSSELSGSDDGAAAPRSRRQWPKLTRLDSRRRVLLATLLLSLTAVLLCSTSASATTPPTTTSTSTTTTLLLLSGSDYGNFDACTTDTLTLDQWANCSEAYTVDKLRQTVTLYMFVGLMLLTALVLLTWRKT